MALSKTTMFNGFLQVIFLINQVITKLTFGQDIEKIGPGLKVEFHNDTMRKWILQSQILFNLGPVKIQ